MPRSAPLLTPEFLERLRAVRGRLFRRPPGGGRRGAGARPEPDFEANRPYEPGDDPRTVDWKIHARLDRLWVRLHLRDDEGEVGVLVDTSRSMRAPEGKLRIAERAAAAYCYLALASGRSLRVGAFAEGLLATRGPWRSLRQLPEALAVLGALPRGGRTSLGRAIEGFLRGARSRATLVIASDLLQEEDVPGALERARARGAGMRLVHVLDRADLAPRVRGDCRAVDVEEERRLDLEAGSDLEQELGERIAAHVAGIAAASRARGIPYLRAATGGDFEGDFLRHVAGGDGRG